MHSANTDGASSQWHALVLLESPCILLRAVSDVEEDLEVERVRVRRQTRVVLHAHEQVVPEGSAPLQIIRVRGRHVRLDVGEDSQRWTKDTQR